MTGSRSQRECSGYRRVAQVQRRDRSERCERKSTRGAGRVSSRASGRVTFGIRSAGGGHGLTYRGGEASGPRRPRGGIAAKLPPRCIGGPPGRHGSRCACSAAGWRPHRLRRQEANRNQQLKTTSAACVAMTAAASHSAYSPLCWQRGRGGEEAGGSGRECRASRRSRRAGGAERRAERARPAALTVICRQKMGSRTGKRMRRMG